MDKAFYASKTVWGFGVAGIIALAQVLGIPIAETASAQIVQILTGLFGLYGLRDAL